MRLSHLAISSLVSIALALPAAEGTITAPAGPASTENITIECSDKPLETVLQWISRRANVNVVCYEQDQPRITLRLANVTWQESVENIATKYDLVVEKKSDRVWVLSRPPKVSISFQDATLPVVLDAIARAADVNIIMSGDVAASGKKLSMSLKGVPWREALDVVVKTVDLAWIETNYKIIRIVSPSSLSRDFQTKIRRINYGTVKELEKAIKPAMGDGTILTDEGTNSLILTGTPLAIAAAERLIDTLDARAREVLIEMRFVDYSTNDVKALGFDPFTLNFSVENLGTVTNTFSPFGAKQWSSAFDRTRNAVPQQTTLDQTGLTFEAIASLGTTEVLQSPSVLTMDNTLAEIVIGREIHFAEESIATSDNGPPVKSLKEAAASPVKDGINIKVTPHITADGFVQIKLEASNDSATLVTFTSGSGASATSIQLPNKDTTSLKHEIMIADGKTAVIGGLLKDKRVEQEGHTPGLGGLPVLGWLFRKESTNLEKRNLTIFITPRIIPLGQKSAYERDLEDLKRKLSGVTEAAPAADGSKSGQPATLE